MVPRSSSAVPPDCNILDQLERGNMDVVWRLKSDLHWTHWEGGEGGDLMLVLALLRFITNGNLSCRFLTSYAHIFARKAAQSLYFCLEIQQHFQRMKCCNFTLWRPINDAMSWDQIICSCGPRSREAGEASETKGASFFMFMWLQEFLHN